MAARFVSEPSLELDPPAHLPFAARALDSVNIPPRVILPSNLHYSPILLCFITYRPYCKPSQRPVVGREVCVSDIVDPPFVIHPLQHLDKPAMTDYHNDSAMSWPLNTSQLEMSPRGRSTRATGFRRQSATSPRIPDQREESPGWPLPKPQRRQPAAIIAKQSFPDLHSRHHTTAAYSQEQRSQSSPHEPVQRQDVPPPSPLRHRLRAKASKLKLVITRGVPDHHLAQSPCGCLGSGCHCGMFWCTILVDEPH